MNRYPMCIAAYSIDNDRINSSSGGLFAEISKVVLDRAGVVFGATIDARGKVFHKYITNRNELHELLGSKYVQSDIGNAYVDVKKFLYAKRLVLFCGTPCQNEGLLQFLNVKPDNLILIDFICHGVPNFKVFNQYLEEISKGRIAEKISFRDKEYGWLDYSFKVNFTNGEEYSAIFMDDLYMRGYILNYFLRPSCYSCKFKGINRKTDITLGDFWGAKEEEAEFFDNGGVSALILHNEKAEKLIENIEDKIKKIMIDGDEIIKHNPSLIYPVDRNIMRGLFFLNLKKGVGKAIGNIVSPTKIYRVRNKLYRIIVKTTKRMTSLTNISNICSKYAAKRDRVILYNKKDNCTGCAACVNICPKSAISMKEDREGFLYPFIDQNLCIACGSCTRVCPLKKSEKE